jgi:hypothetical protein
MEQKIDIDATSPTRFVARPDTRSCMEASPPDENCCFGEELSRMRAGW